MDDDDDGGAELERPPSPTYGEPAEPAELAVTEAASAPDGAGPPAQKLPAKCGLVSPPPPSAT